MEDYRQKSIEELIELLSEKTRQYSEILLQNSDEIFGGSDVPEYISIKEELLALRNEIHRRNTEKASHK